MALRTLNPFGLSYGRKEGIVVCRWQANVGIVQFSVQSWRDGTDGRATGTDRHLRSSRAIVTHSRGLCTDASSSLHILAGRSRLDSSLKFRERVALNLGGRFTDHEFRPDSRRSALHFLSLDVEHSDPVPRFPHQPRVFNVSCDPSREQLDM